MCAGHTHSHTYAYMCSVIGMRVGLSQVIPNSPGLSQTASRWSRPAHIPARRNINNHTNAQTRTSTAPANTQKYTQVHTCHPRDRKDRSCLLPAAAVCNPQRIWHKCSIVTKTLSVFHGCLMMFYHPAGFVFTFLCAFKKTYKKKQHISLQNSRVG